MIYAVYLLLLQNMNSSIVETDEQIADSLSSYITLKNLKQKCLNKGACISGSKEDIYKNLIQKLNIPEEEKKRLVRDYPNIKTKKTYKGLKSDKCAFYKSKFSIDIDKLKRNCELKKFYEDRILEQLKDLSKEDRRLFIEVGKNIDHLI